VSKARQVQKPNSYLANRMDAKGEFVYHIINKLNGILLIVTRVDFQRPDPGGIIYCRILKTSDSMALKVPQRDKFNINLDVDDREPLWSNVACE
jgi:hypothetical protein